MLGQFYFKYMNKGKQGEIDILMKTITEKVKYDFH